MVDRDGVEGACGAAGRLVDKAEIRSWPELRAGHRTILFINALGMDLVVIKYMFLLIMFFHVTNLL